MILGGPYAAARSVVQEDARVDVSHRLSRLIVIGCWATLVILAFVGGVRFVQNGVGLTDDSFLYIDRGLSLNHDFAPSQLKPGWFPPGYGALLGLFLAIDGGPIGAASWLNATLLLVLALALFKGLAELTGDAPTALALAVAAVISKAVTWPFQFAWSEPVFLTLTTVTSTA